MTQQKELEHKVVESIRRISGNWTSISFNVAALSGITSASTRPEPFEMIKLPPGLMDTITELREAMVDSIRGAWFTMTAHIPRRGEPEFSYDWISKPNWGFDEDVATGCYLDDLRKYPRSPEYIPEWFPRGSTPE